MRTLLIMLAVGMAACRPDLDVPAGFDAEAWRQDRRGCQGLRAQQRESWQQLEPQLEGLSQIQIRKLLGPPDEQVLYRRDQKFFVYYLAPGNQCDSLAEKPPGRQVRLRFSAIDELNEISYYNY